MNDIKHLNAHRLGILKMRPAVILWSRKHYGNGRDKELGILDDLFIGTTSFCFLKFGSHKTLRTTTLVTSASYVNCVEYQILKPCELSIRLLSHL